MPVTNTQLDSIFSKQLGRPATDYEYNTYKNSSIQDLGNIGSSYSKLNTGTSISDYLKSIGQDSSIQNRTALGQKYGISGIGTAQGNTALLNALKGSTSPATTSNAQSGTLTGAGNASPAYSPIGTTSTGQTFTPTAVNPLGTVGNTNTATNGTANATNPTVTTQPDQNSPGGGQIYQGQDGNYYDSATGQVVQAPNMTINPTTGQPIQPNASVLSQPQTTIGNNTIPSVQGTIGGAAATYNPALAGNGSTNSNIGINGGVSAPTVSSGTNINPDGSISGALGSSSVSSTGGYQSDPALGQAYNAYTAVQSQIANIDKALSNSLQNKIAQVAQSGAVVDEAQLMGMVNAENAPLIAQRKDLATQQANLGKSYQALLATDKQNRSDYYTQEKIDQTSQNNEANQAIKTSQLALNGEKVLQSGVKVEKVNTYDEYGTVTGQTIRLVSTNPDGTTTTMPPGVGGVGSDGKVDPNLAVDPTTGLAVGTIGSPAINVSLPGYTTQVVPHTGNLTQASIDLYALSALMNNGKLPSLGNSSKGAAAAMKSAIIAREGELDPGGNLFANNANAKALASSLSQQIQYAVSTSRSLESAKDGLNQIITDFTGKGINTSDVTLENVFDNAAKYQISPATIASYKAALQEVANEYSQVFSRGGVNTVASHQSAEDILNGNISLDALKAVGDELQTQGNIVIKNANDAVTGVQNKFNNVLSGNLPDTSTTPPPIVSAGSTVTYNGQTYSVDADGNMTPQ